MSKNYILAETNEKVMGEFEQYLAEGQHSSSIGHEIQLWGVRDYADVETKGISFHWPDEWDAFNPDGFDDEDYDPPRSLRLECAKDVADSVDIPLFWIGEHNANWRELEGTAEIGIIEQDSSGFFADTHEVDIDPDSGGSGRSEMEGLLQDIMQTSLTEYDTNKEENRRITPVQHWVRSNMPKHYAVIDIDILVGDKDGNARGVVEIRRSDWANGSEGGRPIRHWWPWLSDRRNYYLLADTAEKAGIQSIMIQHLPELLSDSSEVGYYTNLEYQWFDWDKIKSDYPWYASERKTREWLSFEVDYITGLEATDRLQNI
jgi:hypothetical protein